MICFVQAGDVNVRWPWNCKHSSSLINQLKKLDSDCRFMFGMVTNCFTITKFWCFHANKHNDTTCSSCASLLWKPTLSSPRSLPRLRPPSLSARCNACYLSRPLSCGNAQDIARGCELHQPDASMDTCAHKAYYKHRPHFKEWQFESVRAVWEPAACRAIEAPPMYVHIDRRKNTHPIKHTRANAHTRTRTHPHAHANMHIPALMQTQWQ